MPSRKHAPAYILAGEWRQDLGPVRQAYTAEQAAKILRCRIVQAEAMDHLRGPASTLTEPVDHDKLETLMATKRRRFQRREARRELMLMLDASLTAAGDPPTRRRR